MVFENIEQLKQKFTDKYVVVDDNRPELRRFRGQTGVVKTVNMSGRALVEFDANLNIGWYDIELDFLKVIDQPLPKPEKSEQKAKAKPATPATTKKPAGKKSGGQATPGMSVEEMLAAARGEKAGGAKPAAPKKDVPAKSSDAKQTSEKPNPAKMSVEEMLAAARGEKAAETTPDVEPEPAATPAETTANASVESEPQAESKADLPKSTEEIVAYCRKIDAS